MRRTRPPHSAVLLRFPALAALALAAVVAAVFSPAPRAAAQRPEELPPLVDEITVEVVNVDVVVTDRHGNPVNGLTRDEFVLYEDGERREISNFYAFAQDRAQIAAGAGAGGDREAWGDRATRRRMVLLFDSASLEKRVRNRSIEALERFILEQFDGTYEWAVVAYRDRLQLMQPFTDDKTAVLAALSRVRDLPVQIRRTHAWDPLPTEDDSTVSRTGSFGLRAGFDQSTDAYITRQEFQLRDRMLSVMQQFDVTAAAMIQTMRAYAGLPGRKALVLITGGLEVVPGPSQLFGRGFPGAGSEDRIDPMATLIHVELQRRYEAIIKTANAAGFAIYPVSGSGVAVESPYIDVDRKVSMVFKGGLDVMPAEIDLDSAPTVLAEGTGGEYFSTTHFYRAFDDIDDRTANAYVLGFRTDRPPDGRYHRLRVRVTKPGLTVKSREGYLHISRQTRLLEELSTPLTFPKDRGDFAVAVEVLPPERMTDKAVTLTVAGTVPLHQVTLIPEGDTMVGRVHLYLAIYDPHGNLVRLFRERQDIALPADRVAAAAPDAPARFGITVKDLERGDYTLSLTLMDEVSDRYGTGLRPVQL
jgi:VWFA-related protein